MNSMLNSMTVSETTTIIAIVFVTCAESHLVSHTAQYSEPETASAHEMHVCIKRNGKIYWIA
jgi:hypothetical protein